MGGRGSRGGGTHFVLVVAMLGNFSSVDCFKWGFFVV